MMGGMCWYDRRDDGAIGGLKSFQEVVDLGADDIPFIDLISSIPRLALYCLDLENELLVFVQLQEVRETLGRLMRCWKKHQHG